MIRSALRALDAVCSIPESVQDRKIQDLLASVQKKENLRNMMEQENLLAASARSSAKRRK